MRGIRGYESKNVCNLFFDNRSICINIWMISDLVDGWVGG